MYDLWTRKKVLGSKFVLEHADVLAAHRALTIDQDEWWCSYHSPPRYRISSCFSSTKSIAARDGHP